jgi:hypothetical protein
MGTCTCPWWNAAADPECPEHGSPTEESSCVFGQPHDWGMWHQHVASDSHYRHCRVCLEKQVKGAEVESCWHVWKNYQGFREVYQYCEKCDQKRVECP